MTQNEFAGLPEEHQPSNLPRRDDGHEHQFPEIDASGTLVLYPCLLCGLAAADAIVAMKAERDAKV